MKVKLISSNKEPNVREVDWNDIFRIDLDTLSVKLINGTVINNVTNIVFPLPTNENGVITGEQLLNL